MTDDPARDVWSDIIGGLVDARTDPVSARFDAEVTAAVAAGSLSEEVAHRLRFWQRASIRVLADHVMAVLPAAFGALDAARRDAEVSTEGSAAALAAAADTKDDSVEGSSVEGSSVEEVEPTQPDDGPAPLRRASSPQAAGSTTLEADRPRLLVAALMAAHERPDRPT